ncbi:MAG: hypothetical protein ABI970_15145 [Chloroflexota bacterium]
MLISCFPTTETDSLEIKLQQFKAIQQAAHELMQQEDRQQAVSTYMVVSKLMLEIELELITRQEKPFDL